MKTFRKTISACLTAAMLMGGAAAIASLMSDTAYAQGNGGNGGNGGGNGGNGGGAGRNDADMYPPRFPSPRDLLPRIPGLPDRGGADTLTGVDPRGVPPPGRIDPGVFDPGRGSPAPRIDPARVPRGGPITPLDPSLFPGLGPKDPGVIVPLPGPRPSRVRNVERNGPVCDPYGVSGRGGIRACGG